MPELDNAAIANMLDTMGDLLVYRSWARTLADCGLAAAYWPGHSDAEDAFLRPPIDYPPVLPYVLLALGRGLAGHGRTILPIHAATWGADRRGLTFTIDLLPASARPGTLRISGLALD